MKKFFATLMTVTMVAGMLAGCGSAKEQPATGSTSAEPNAASTAGAPLKIGMTGPLTGDNSAYGIAVRGGMQVAVDEINAKGGLQIDFRAEDDEADVSDKAVAAYNTLKDWGMQLFAGATTTGSSLTLAAETANDEIFMLTPSASAVDVAMTNTLKDWGMQLFAGATTTGSSLTLAAETANDEIFMLTPSASAVDVAMTGTNVHQMCFTDPNQGASAAELMAQKWPDATIGMIYDSSDAYSSGVAEGFLAKAQELNLNVAVSDAAFTADNKADLSTQVTKCKDAGCDLVFLPFYYAEASRVLTYANSIGYKPTFFGCDGDLSTQVTKCKDAGCDLVFLPFYYAEASRVLTYANSIGYKPTFFGCDGMDGILTVEGFNHELAEGLVLMTPFDANATDERTVAFVEQFKANNDGLVPNQFAADGYDVIYALYDACVAAGIDGSTAPQDVAFVEQFKANNDGLVPNQFAADGYDVIYALYDACVAAGIDGSTAPQDACTKLCEQFQSMTFDGLTGKDMSWDANGMISKAPAAVVVTDGVYVPMA